MNAKGNALKKKAGGHGKRLESIRKSIRKENVSYGELAELQSHKKHLYNDPELAEAAGIPESEFRKHQSKK